MTTKTISPSIEEYMAAYAPFFQRLEGKELAALAEKKTTAAGYMGKESIAKSDSPEIDYQLKNSSL
ncbi:MAG: hypothetical protein QMD92_07670 [bacterium]|nr:hypothetical protein [bacterium]